MHYAYAQVDHFNWTYEDGEYSIDLSKNNRFRALHTLSGLNVTKLNISYSEEAQFEHFYTPNLRYVDLSYSKLETSLAYYLDKENFPNLETLILDDSTSRDQRFNDLANTSIKHLSMKRVKVLDYMFVRKMQNLESITLDKAPKNFPQELKHLLIIKP